MTSSLFNIFINDLCPLFKNVLLLNLASLFDADDLIILPKSKSGLQIEIFKSKINQKNIYIKENYLKMYIIINI